MVRIWAASLLDRSRYTREMAPMVCSSKHTDPPPEVISTAANVIHYDRRREQAHEHEVLEGSLFRVRAVNKREVAP